MQSSPPFKAYGIFMKLTCTSVSAISIGISIGIRISLTFTTTRLNTSDLNADAETPANLEKLRKHPQFSRITLALSG